MDAGMELIVGVEKTVEIRVCTDCSCNHYHKIKTETKDTKYYNYAIIRQTYSTLFATHSCTGFAARWQYYHAAVEKQSCLPKWQDVQASVGK